MYKHVKHEKQSEQTQCIILYIYGVLNEHLSKF